MNESNDLTIRTQLLTVQLLLQSLLDELIANEIIDLDSFNETLKDNTVQLRQEIDSQKMEGQSTVPMEQTVQDKVDEITKKLPFLMNIVGES
jgi:hypothetical protein